MHAYEYALHMNMHSEKTLDASQIRKMPIYPNKKNASGPTKTKAQMRKLRNTQMRNLLT